MRRLTCGFSRKRRCGGTRGWHLDEPRPSRLADGRTHTLAPREAPGQGIERINGPYTPRSNASPDGETSTSGSPRRPRSRLPPGLRRINPGRSRSRSPPRRAHRPGPTISWNSAMPSTPSGSRPDDNRLPSSSCTCTSWWASAQSTPTKIIYLFPLHRRSTVFEPRGLQQLPNGSVLEARHPTSRPRRPHRPNGGTI